jgi:hypothetical protein
MAIGMMVMPMWLRCAAPDRFAARGATPGTTLCLVGGRGSRLGRAKAIAIGISDPDASR